MRSGAVPLAVAPWVKHMGGCAGSNNRTKKKPAHKQKAQSQVKKSQGGALNQVCGWPIYNCLPVLRVNSLGYSLGLSYGLSIWFFFVFLDSHSVLLWCALGSFDIRLWFVWMMFAPNPGVHPANRYRVSLKSDLAYCSCEIQYNSQRFWFFLQPNYWIFFFFYLVPCSSEKTP